MGQEISLSDFKIPDLSATNTVQSNDVSSSNQTEDIHLFLPFDIITEMRNASISLPNEKISNELSNANEVLINQIRQDISVFSEPVEFKEFNAKLTEIIKKMLDYIATKNTSLQNCIQSITNKQEQLRKSYDEKLKDDENEMTSIFSDTLVDSEKLSNEQQIEELSYFAVQSLINMLLMLLQSVHKFDSTMIHQILNLTNQLVEQIPLNILSSDIYKRSHNLFKSLKPLTNYIENLSIQTDLDPIATNQSIKILLNFSIMKASFKDILPLIRKLIFNTIDTFDIRKLLLKLNKQLTMTKDRFEKEKHTTSIAQDTMNNNNITTQDQNRTETILAIDKTIEYLTLIGAYPNTQLITLNEKNFTGQFICSIILVHIDLHNQVHSKSKFESNSVNGSFSFELAVETFKYLYDIIEQLIEIEKSSNTNLEYILNVCLRLFTTHLKFLIDANFDNFHDFLNETDIEKWFTLISKIVMDHHSEERKKEAAQALIYLIEKQTLSFGQMLIFIHKHILDNQHSILIEKLLNKLNQQVFIYRWIEILCDNQHTEDRSLAYTVLHSLIDLVLKPTSIDNEQVNRLREILFMFQDLLLVYLHNQSINMTDELESSALSTLGIEYTTHIIKYCLQEQAQSVLFEPLLFGLCTLTEPKFNFAIIQPIFAAIMPLFAEYILKSKLNVDDKINYVLPWLLGKMSHRLIVGPPPSSLEKKYSKTLKSPLFSGGYETITTDINPYLSNLFKSDLAIYSQFLVPLRRQQSILDNNFLISIYQNIDQGAILISKIKLFIRHKQYVLLKSIESIVDDACAALFAVYIKHYRRIDLAQYELMQPLEQKPHAKLLILYEYANEIRRIFTETKASGGDCHELWQKIKNDTLLLLVSIRESCFISKIKENYFLSIPTTPTTPMNKPIQFLRQQSHWTKAKNIVRLLRITFNACIRLKSLMLEKKRTIENKQDSESIMHRAITHFFYENEKFKINSNDIVQCLIRQYQRAMTRLITYKFLEQLIISSKDNNNNQYLVLLFTNLKPNHLDWHYLDNIEGSHNQLKEDIGHLYYKILKNLLIESNRKTLCIFNLINLNYESMDLCLLNDYQFLQTLFDLIETDKIDLDLKLTVFNWFRLVVLKLCENIELEQIRNQYLGNRKFHQILKQQCHLIFNKIIFNELKQFQENQDVSLKKISLRSFIRSSKIEQKISLDQYLILLLRCIHLYDYIRLNYATINYIEQLFNLYHTSQSLVTRLLILKILRDLLIYVPDHTNRSFIENLLTKIFLSIGKNFNLLEREKIDLEIIIEYIYIYRTILSYDSPWQKFATLLLVNSIKFFMNINLKSLETIEFEQMNSFLASICILGGYIQPYCLGSTVKIYSSSKDIHESAIIIEINRDALESNSSDNKPYLIQYATTNQTEWTSSNQIRTIVDVQSPNLSNLPIDNAVDTILDTFGYLLQTIDVCIIDSLILLDIKCRLVKALYDILNYKQVIEIFIDKPYASIITKLAISMDYFDSIRSRIPNDLRLFNQLHLEQYYLSLDRFVRKNQIVENKFDMIIPNEIKIIRDPIILQYLSGTNSIEQGWKPIASRYQIKSYKKGRLGNDDIQIKAMPTNDNNVIITECGIKHIFKGQVNIDDNIGNIRHRTFIPDGIELNEGKWYFCVRFPQGGTAVIGWATKGFNPPVHDSYGIGGDDYSWGFDRTSAIYECRRRKLFLGDSSWDADAVCGCGIEIDGKNTTIKYWLNDQFIGTIYSQVKNDTIKSKIKTNLLPNGIFPTYFPAVSIQTKRNSENRGVFEFIFSPEDMTKCPLPQGYKPLLIPKLLTMENVLVPYPSNAYLIGNDIQQYFYTDRCSKNDSDDKVAGLLRDFVDDQHLKVSFNIDIITKDNHLLKLSQENDGFPLSFDNHQELTISFDFEFSRTENPPDELDIILFTLDDIAFSLHLRMIDETKLDRQHIVILFDLNKQTKVYINNNKEFQILNHYHSFNPKLNIRLLPHLNVGIQNLGLWTHLLSEEHIQRLLTYGLSYVAIDYQNLKEYQKRISAIEFKAEQKYFTNENLVPFDKPFTPDRWKEIKQSVNHDESNYFKTIPNSSQSVVQLFGNKTYLVLNTANQVWSEYTIILDIFLPNFSIAKNLAGNQTRLTLMSLDEKSEIYVTSDGHIHITDEHQSSSPMKFNEYIRLVISIQQYSIHIYVNGSLELDVSIGEDQFATKLKHIDLFRELDLTKNMINDDQLRIECRSITYLNKSMQRFSSSMKKLLQSSEYSLKQLVKPSFDILATSLIGIGYKEQAIKYVMKKYNTTKISFINNILREESQCIENICQQEEHQKRLDVLRRLNSYDENERLQMLIDNNDVNTDKLSILKSDIDNDDDDIPADKKWFYDTMRSVGICDKLDDWFQDKQINNQIIAGYTGYHLLDLTKTDSNEFEFTNKSKKIIATSSHYTHREIPLKVYIHSRITCEYGLITIYARQTMLNMLKVWSNDNYSNLFPLLKFGNTNGIVKLIQTMHHHHIYTHVFTDTTINRMDLLVISIITAELKDLLQSIVHAKLTIEIFNEKAPVFFQLQKQIINESIHFLTEPAFIDIDNNNNDITIDEQIFIKQSNLDFLLKIFHLFLEVLNDFKEKNSDIDLVIQLLFPNIMIKILFDLFLLVPSHQSKKFILTIFTKLIQTSENFKLHDDIHNFLRHLFLESTVNDIYCRSLALKFLRRSLLQIEFMLIEREKQLFSSISEWSPFMKDIAIILDLITILTNKKQPCQLSELVFTECKELLGETLPLTNEMVETANTYFDRTADKQVIKFMNENIKLDDDSLTRESIINFIETLPIEASSSSSQYASFTCLCNIPSIHMQTRVKLLHVFNMLLGSTLRSIDFNVTSGIGFVVDRIRSVRHCILFIVKYGVFRETLDKTAIESLSSEIDIKFDIVKASVVEHPENTMFYQAYKQLKSNASEIFRRKMDERCWKATYVGMFSIDQGGPYRDSITRMCADLCSTRTSLFILCPNGRTNNGLNRDRWIPNVFPPNRAIPIDIRDQYRFVGQFMGMAIRTKQYLDVRFPILLWKQLIYEEVTIEDIEAIDISSFVIINQMEKNILKVKSLNECDYLFSSIMTPLTFDVVSSAGQSYELIPGGFHIQITAANFEDYCKRYRQYRINEFYRQIEFIRQGLYSVVPWGYLTLFTAHELEKAVCGKGYIDIEMLKRHTEYDEDDESSPHIQRFWSILSEMFSEEQKKLFLVFVWGRNTLPYTDDDFSMDFKIARLETSGNIDDALPKSFTCTFTLQLPIYSTKEIMYERLNYAITYCATIDADGRMN